MTATISYVVRSPFAQHICRQITDTIFLLVVSFASLVAHRMRFLGEDSVTAGKRAIDELGKHGGVGGSIVLDHDGNVSFPMNSTTMNRGYISSLDGEKARVALFPGEELA